MERTNKFWLESSPIRAVARSMFNVWDIIILLKALEITDNYQLVEGRFIEKIFHQIQKLGQMLLCEQEGQGRSRHRVWGWRVGECWGLTYGYQKTKGWSWVSFKASHFMIWLVYLEIGEHYEGEYRDNRQVCDHWACWSFPEEKCFVMAKIQTWTVQIVLLE